MSVIIDFFTGLYDTVANIILWFINFLKDLLYVTKLIRTFVWKLPELVSWLPGTLVAMLVVVFSIVIIYKILGREG